MTPKGKRTSARMCPAPALRAGSLIRAVAPAGPFDPVRFHEAEAWLKGRGYRVRYDRGIFAKADYLAGEDDRRAAEFNAAWADPEAAAVFCARGGYGSTRIAEKLDEKKLRKHRKLFMGLSDLTILLNLVARKAGVVTVHGPVLAGDTFLNLTPELKERLFSRLERPEETILREPLDFRTIFPGLARGRLFGGNLSLVQASLGTKYEVPFDGVILFLEEVSEPRYRIDRMLGHLAAYGALRKLRGLVLGQFSGPDRATHELVWLKSLVGRYLGGRKIPVLAALKAGHGRNEVLLPIGGEVRIDTSKRTFALPPLVQ